MVGETIVLSIELVGGTTLVLSIGALTAAAGRLRKWIARKNPGGLRPASEAAQPIAQVRAQIAPYRDAAGDALLAKALDISQEALREARDRAHSRILSHLLNEGIITVSEARKREARGYSLQGPYGLVGGSTKHGSDEAVFLAFLAESLGITVSELQEAREAALEEALTIAVEEGVLTEDQMEDRLMRYRAQRYVEPGPLLAESLDITLEELDQRSLDAWLIQRQLDWRALTARLSAAREDGLAQAVADGELNRDEADRLVRESVWAPLLDMPTLPDRHAGYGFLYLHDTDDVLN